MQVSRRGFLILTTKTVIEATVLASIPMVLSGCSRSDGPTPQPQSAEPDPNRPSWEILGDMNDARCGTGERDVDIRLCQKLQIDYTAALGRESNENQQP